MPEIKIFGRKFAWGKSLEEKSINIIQQSDHNYFHTDGVRYVLNAEPQDNPYFLMVADKLAKVCSTLPLVATQNDSKYQGFSPNFRDSLETFYYKIVYYLLRDGNVALYRQDLARTQGSVFVLRQKDLKPQGENQYEYKIIKSYNHTHFGTIQAEDILIFNLFPPEDSCWGDDPKQRWEKVLKSSTDIFTAKSSIFQNRGTSGILSPKDPSFPLLPTEQSDLQKSWDRQNSGASKYGKIHITTASMDYQSIGMNSKELELLGHNMESLRDICRFFGVDSSIFSDNDAKTYANRKEATISLYNDVCLPIMDTLLPDISEFVGIPAGFGAIEVEKDKIPILNLPNLEISKKVVEEVKAGILTPEEGKAQIYE